MKENNELERKDICVDREMDVDCDIGQEITAYLETWFDIDKKFGTDTAKDDDKCLNLYAKYNPFEDTLRLEYTVSTSNSWDCYEYTPTEDETKLIKEMISEKIMQEHGQTPQEFCEVYYGEEPENNMNMGGVS